jgi:hypothetical protein
MSASPRTELCWFTAAGDAMRVRVYSAGKFYLIECSERTRVDRHAVGSSEPNDLLVVQFEGQEIAIPNDPSELLPL